MLKSSPARNSLVHGRAAPTRPTAWYSGWYIGLARKHYMDIVKGKEPVHEVIVYCKANAKLLAIEAITVVF